MNPSTCISVLRIVRWVYMRDGDDDDHADEAFHWKQWRDGDGGGFVSDIGAGI